MRRRNLSFIAAAVLGAGCGSATTNEQPEGDVLGSLQHGLESRLEQRFGKGARVQQVFGLGDEVMLGVASDAKVEESDVRAPLAIARYRASADALTVISDRAEFFEARLLAGATALVSTSGQLTLRAANGVERTIATDVKGEVSAAPGGRLLFTQEGGARSAGDSVVTLAGADGTLTVLAEADGVNDRPALSTDGKTLVFVSGRTGVASLWRTTLAGAPPVQLTNLGIEAGLEREGPPQGFVPPPLMADRIEWLSDDVIRYDAGDAEFWQVNVRTGVASREGV